MSRIIDILTTIRDGSAYTAEPQSRVERILLAIKNGTEYTDVPQSRHEKLLLSIKNGQKVGCLLPFPYKDGAKTDAGVAYTVHSDGRVTVNGTATAYSAFILSTSMDLVDGRTYTLSGAAPNIDVILQYRDETGKATYVRSGEAVTWSAAYTFVNVYLQVPSNKTIDNVTVLPVLCEGTADSAFPEMRAPSSRLEAILFAIANGTLDGYLSEHNTVESELEEAYIQAASALKKEATT